MLIQPRNHVILFDDRGRANSIPSGIRGKWVATERVPFFKEGPANALLEGQKAFFTSGWNGSFHDAWYFPQIVCWGRSPSRAKKALKKALESVEEINTRPKDIVAARMEARQIVRPGD